MFSVPPNVDERTGDEVARLQQRAVAERLLLGALHSQDIARRAVESERRATFLVSAGRAFSGVVDQEAIRDIVRRCVLPRPGSWCMVDIVESSGEFFRLAAVHPDPAKKALALRLEDPWDAPLPSQTHAAPRPLSHERRELRVIDAHSGDALIAAAGGEKNLAILRQIGFGELLVVPFAVRATVLGAITFVTGEGDTRLSQDEISLATSLAEQCAFALDNARLYLEAEGLRGEADRANRAKSIFLGNMTHELMTPLNAIGGYAELLELGLRGPVTSEQRTDLERIKCSQQHLIALIKGILEYVHSDTGLIRYSPVVVAVEPLLREMAEMLNGAATAKNLVIRVNPGEDGVAVTADPVRVRQILANLVSNAVKYSSPGDDDITLSFSAGREAVELCVKDAGPGIPPDHLGAVFQPFVQLSSGLSDRQGGVGLGLAISRDLATGMKGHLIVESTVGVGSLFTLVLPRAGPAWSDAGKQ